MVFEEDSNDSKLDGDNIHPDVPTKESDFKELFENSDNDSVIMNDDWWIFYCNRMDY